MRKFATPGARVKGRFGEFGRSLRAGRPTGATGWSDISPSGAYLSLPCSPPSLRPLSLLAALALAADAGCSGLAVPGTIAARDAPLRLVGEDTFAEGLEVDAVRVYGRTDPRTPGRW